AWPVPALSGAGRARAPGGGTAPFRDATAGTTGLFEPVRGFDLATGWGAPLAGALADALDGPGRCEPLIDAARPERGCLVPTGRGAATCAAEWLGEQDTVAPERGPPPVPQTCRGRA